MFCKDIKYKIETFKYVEVKYTLLMERVETIKTKNHHSDNLESSERTSSVLTLSVVKTSNSQNPENNNYNWRTIAGRLQKLCNKYGDFKVAKSWKKPDGEVIWSKHRSVLECWETEWGIQWLGQVSHRQILPCEIVIDLDDNPTEEQLNWICDKLDILGENYIAYFTGSKGYHIHIKDKHLALLSKYQREQIRLKLLHNLTNKADLHKKDEVMIALEEVPHWKTGKLKTEVRRSSNWENF